MSKTSPAGPAREPQVGSVAHAAAILRRLAQLSEPEGVNAISRAIGVSPSSCFNILKTLAREELVEFDEATKRYALGPGLVMLARKALDPGQAFAVARPALERLADKHGVTIALWRLTRERLVLLGFADSDEATRIHMTVGQRLPMLVGAGGRCVAARLNLPPEALAREFPKLRWQEPPTLAAYVASVAEARESGWSVDDSCFLRGVTTVGASVPARSGPPAGVLSATMFAGQHDPAAWSRIGEDLAACAETLAL
jgi:DNA-binding IclR family transcriptional regulator